MVGNVSHRYCSWLNMALLSLCVTSDNVGWKAAQEVFGQRLHHLLCRWYLDKYVFAVYVSFDLYMSLYVQTVHNVFILQLHTVGHGETMLDQKYHSPTNLIYTKHSV